MLAVLKRNPVALLFALALHVVLAWVLIAGVDWQEKPEAIKSDAQIVRAQVVNQQDLAKEVEQLQKTQRDKQKAEEKRIAELKKRREQEKRRLAEIERKRKQQEKADAKRLADIKQQQAAEKKRLLKLTQERELAEKQRIAEEEKRLAAEKQRKAEEAKRRQQEEQKRLAAEKRAQEEQAALERELQAQYASEKAASEAARITQLIRQKVARYWNRPQGTAEQGLTCRVKVRLGTSGSILAVTVVQSSGHSAFDRSVLAAVWKADPLPMPDNPDLRNRTQFRQHEFIFDPAKGAL